MSEVRLPEFTDLSDPDQIRDLIRVLKDINVQLTRTSMTKEVPRSGDTTDEDHRFRVVDNDIAPGTDDHGKTEVQFNIGGKWKRVMLEDI